MDFNFSKKIFRKFLEKKVVLLCFLLLFSILTINSIHFFYPDEFDNILGGYYLTQGRFLYSEYFTHHAPFAYIFSAFITLFSSDSFVKFRILLALTYFCMMIVFYSYINRRFSGIFNSLILVFFFFITLGSTYYFGQMMLADTLAGYLIVPSYIILFLSFLKKEKLSLSDLIVVNTLAGLTILTSQTYIYAALVVYVFTTISFFSKKQFLHSFKTYAYFILSFFAPFLLLLLYLLVTQSLYDFYYQAIFFNQEYYLKMPDGSPVRNPIRFALVLFYNFFDNFKALILQIKDLNFSFPFNQTLALSNLLILIYFLLNKQFKLALMIFGVMVYLNARSNPYTSKETDYQSTSYILFSLFNGLFLLKTVWQNLKERIETNLKSIYVFILLLLGIYYFFLSIFVFQTFFDKAYKKYMGIAPLIYDRPIIAPVLNNLLDKKDYYYIGPFFFEEHLYVKAKLASRYLVTIPAMDQSEKIKKELLQDMEKNRPKIVVFNIDDRIFGSHPGGFLVEYLKKNYFTIDELNRPKIIYTKKYHSFGDYNRFDFGRHFFFDKSKKDEVIKTLLNKGYISKNS